MRNLTLPQRRTLEALCKQKLSQAEMARRLGVHRSTVCRELKRNTFNGVYEGELAYYKSHARKHWAGKENQTERLSPFLDPLAQEFRNLRFKITMEKRERRYRPLYALRRKYPFRYDDGPRIRCLYNIKKDDRFFRKRKRIFRGYHYKRWKRWYDRDVRQRYLILENDMRLTRFDWNRNVYRKPYHLTTRKKRNYGWENYNRTKHRIWEIDQYRWSHHSLERVRYYSRENARRIRPPYWKTAHYYKAYHKKNYSDSNYRYRSLFHSLPIDIPVETAEPVPQVASVPEEVTPVTKRRVALKPVPPIVPAYRVVPKPRPKAWRRTKTRAHSPPT